MVSSVSAKTTGLRRPQTYSKLTATTGSSSNENNDNSGLARHFSSPYGNQPSLNETSSNNNISSSMSSRITRPRRPSIIGNKPTPTKSTLPLPNSTGSRNNTDEAINRQTIRQRTMSDAGRLNISCLHARSPMTRNHRQRADLRRSLYLEQDNLVKSMHLGLKGENNNNSGEMGDDDYDNRSNNSDYQNSAPLLNAYGVPTMKSKASMGALKYTPSVNPTASMSTVAHVSSPASISTMPSSSTTTLPPSDLNQKIRVCVRKRPLNRKELEKGEKDISPCIGTRSLHINEPKLRLDMSKYVEQHSFTFDDVFDLDTANSKIYERTALPLVNYIFDGGKATCFAYGQTGSGKTFTMLDPKHGLYILAAKDIFSLLRQSEHQHLSAWIGLYEIYQGQLYDLLNKRKKLFAREDGKHNVIISGLKEYPIDNVDKLIHVFDYGSQVRSTGSTGANDSSSRSHAVLQVLLKPKKNKKKIHGKLSFIDLAGSERGADRGEADTKTRMEGAEINKSLLALKECIRALDQDKQHTPFRQSKLTQVLKDSFLGNARTCMIATISPGGSNSEHTLNTLRYADRVKELKGETDRRTKMACAGPNIGVDPYGDGENNEDSYIYDDSFNDGNSQYDSDILDEDTYNVLEENIFDVDFPLEHDDLIRSNIYTVIPAKQPVPQIPTTITSFNQAVRHGPSTSAPRCETDERNEYGTSIFTPSETKNDRQPHALPTPQNTYIPNNSDTYDRNIDATTQHTNLTPSNLGYNDMEDFVQLHRAEIRAMAYYSKRENKLVATLSLQLASNQYISNSDEDNVNGSDENDDITGFERSSKNGVKSSPGQYKTSQQFRAYLHSLDDILQEKTESIAALRERVNSALSRN
ncbi:P-loop containing nucleoside triphosphate hydrolase protein [Absidia repens]|uniref:Kinesin-like protein n=1 Tax=Absidia repens TaxID=90262 RepID=A0A1X2HY83_9FUNG|nr:P-loop containing nucleoside triphosphate hydrolase protein [Absidia repens]